MKCYGFSANQEYRNKTIQEELYSVKEFILQTCISVHFSQKDDSQCLRQPECAKILE